MPDHLDPKEVVDLLEAYLLEGPRTLTGPQIAAEVGISMEVARERWRSLGFSAVPDDELAFTDSDLDAMRLTQRIHEVGLVDPGDESALIRTVGRNYARLAEWQVRLLGRAIDMETSDLEELTTMVTEFVPEIEHLQRYVWRRHVLNAASRMLLAPTGADEELPVAIGFADIVGYTRQSRSLSRAELARLVEEFEATALAILTSHGGRIIKTIGDEVMFETDTPKDAALIALELVEGHLEDEGFPELRVGVSWGSVLHRLGDVFGPTVNVASRLTSTARPGRVVVDRDLADELAEDQDFRVRRMRRTSVKGYRRLELWSLRRGGDSALPPAAAFLQEKGEDVLRAVEELQERAESVIPSERLE